MKISPIKTEKDYQAALKEIERLVNCSRLKPRASKTKQLLP
jgi:antitoxin component HigA of HigAB toxin-antitoxin module